LSRVGAWITIDGMTESEPRTFRNWHAISYFGFGMVGFGLVGPFDDPPLWFASIACALLLLAAARPHVIVYGTEVELNNVFRQHRIPLSQIDDLSVLFSRGWHGGWRIRLRFFGAGFAEPPADAPVPLKELYALLSARMAMPPGRDHGA
jgi:hypothetical protein